MTSLVLLLTCCLLQVALGHYGGWGKHGCYMPAAPAPAPAPAPVPSLPTYGAGLGGYGAGIGSGLGGYGVGVGNGLGGYGLGVGGPGGYGVGIGVGGGGGYPSPAYLGYGLPFMG